MSGINDDAEIDFGVDFDLDEQEPPRVEPPRVEQQEADKKVAKLSDAIYGLSETGQEHGNIYTRNVPIEDLSNARRKDIIAKGKRSRADYVGDAELSTFNNAWRDAADVLNEQKMQETQTKKRKRGGGRARKTNTKTKSKKQRKNKSRKSRRVSHKK